MDATATWIIVAVVVLALLALAAVLLMRRRKDAKDGEHMRERFGPEYDRQVRERGGERAARQHLHDVEERRSRFDVKPLSEESRSRYLARWQAVQTDFVDRPGKAVDDAARLVDDVMDERGYPGGNEDERSELMAADHPQVVEQYRAANDARRRHHTSGDQATTEELRRAMVHYRELVTLLVEDGRQGEAPGDDTDRPTAPPQDDGDREPADGDRGEHGSHPEDRHRVEDRDRLEGRARVDDRGDDHPRHRAE